MTADAGKTKPYHEETDAEGIVTMAGCGHGVADQRLQHRSLAGAVSGPVGLGERNLILLVIGLMLLVVVPVFVMTLWFAWQYRASNRGSISPASTGWYCRSACRWTSGSPQTP
jgi:heme/copper-type cytochrome/quinol oxidase subunit 2